MTRRHRDSGIAPALAALATVLLPLSILEHHSRSVAPIATAQAAEPDCPLPLSQQLEAVKAFAAMMPAFRHPRCFNCHGGFDIASDAHPGSDLVTNTDIDPKEVLTVAERVALHEGCDNCHVNVRGAQTRLDGTKLHGWLIAPPPMQWVDKNDEAMCKDMKRFEPTGEQFVDHIENDHGEIQFIEAAFRGDRALAADDLKEYDVVVAKPPGTHADLIAQARKWVQLVGSGYTASPECGCVAPKIGLEVRHSSEVDPNHITYRSGTIGFSGDVSFAVTLAPVEGADRLYQGTASVQRPLRVYHANRFCTGTASQQEDWHFLAEIDEHSASMKVDFSFTTSQETGISECRLPGIVDRAEIYPDMYSDLEPLDVPFLDRATKEWVGRDPLGQATESVALKVVATPTQ